MSTKKAVKPAEPENRAEDQAKAQLQSIIEMVNALQKAENEDNEKEKENAQQAILEDPLSVEIRSDWYIPGSKQEAAEYRILLCWGGPAVQITGDLDKYNQPETAVLQYQDWFTGWKDYMMNSEETEKALEYAKQFYFGE